MKCHSVFYVSLLEPAASDPPVGQKPPPPPSIIIDNNINVEFEEILDPKLVCRTLKCFVHWVGYKELT